MKPKTIRELGVFLNSSQDAHTPITGFSVDSRTIKPGEVYFALPGVKVDGHTFLSEVSQKGAAAAVVSRNYEGNSFGLPLIHAGDVLKSLQELAKKTLQSYPKPKILGITGSVGKTTTKDFTTTLLKQKYRVASSPGNSNSQVGLPLAILNHTTGDEEVIVLEMSMTHPGQIARLVEIAPPLYALITVVAYVHSANFPHLEAIANAKAEIFGSPSTQAGIFPYEVAAKQDVLKSGNCAKVTFSMTAPEADYYLRADDGKLHLKALTESLVLPAPKVLGAHNQYNLLAAIALVRQFGLGWDEIAKGIEQLQLPEKRLQIVSKNGITFVNDAYNASLLSVKGALNSLPEPQQGGKRIAVLGEMLELGRFSESCHREVGEHALQKVDHMLCLGQGCGPIWETWNASHKPVEWKQTRGELVEALRKITGPGDVVLLKASRSFEMWKVLDEF